MTLSLGYSPCPNDTFMFHALTHGEIDFSHELDVKHRDVSTLNEMALKEEIDITKASMHAYGHLTDNYVLLNSGAALGQKVGPILVSNETLDIDSLSDKSIVIPGELTTAYLLLRLFDESALHQDVKRYEEIMPSVQRGEYDAGLVIHEGRFTYPDYDLVKVLDLGEWWSKEHSELVPLGGIIARRDLGEEVLRSVQNGIQESIEYGYRSPDASREYVKEHAQEMNDEVIERHIQLYVNEYSIDMKPEGKEAVKEMLDMGQELDVIPEIKNNLFLD